MNITFIEVPIRSAADLPFAYDVAIKQAAFICYEDADPEDEHDPNYWAGTIELTKIKFENNYKRSEYIACFRVTEG